MLRLMIYACLLATLAVGAAVEAQPPRAEGLPDGVRIVRDVPYAGTDNPRQTLDLLLPSEPPQQPLPVVAYVHGGAWLAGDKRAGLGQLAAFVRGGRYAGVSIGYRLSQEATWPAQIHDCKAAIRWLRANAQTHHLDPQRIGVIGPSAGGHLVAVLGASGGVAAMDGALGPHQEMPTHVACVVDLFGPTDFTKMNEARVQGGMDHDSARAPEALLIGGPVQQNPEQAAAANPITYVTADAPPFLIVHGTRDPLVPFNQSQLLHDALRAKRTRSTLITVQGGGHGLGFPAEVQSLVAAFFNHHLLGAPLELEDRTLQATGPQATGPQAPGPR